MNEITIPIDILDSGKSDTIKNLIVQIIKKKGPHPKMNGFCRHLDNNTILNLINCEKVKQSILNFTKWDSVYLWSSGIFIKNPGYKGTPLHQDIRFWSPLAASSVTLWITFSDTTNGNAPFAYLPFSSEKQFAYINDNGYDYVSLNHIKKENLVKLEMRKGQGVIFNANLLHGSYPNITNEPRISIAFRFSPQNYGKNILDKEYLFNKFRILKL